jgi:DNA-directed RNA polymerase subunit RPC12/RpoP
MESENMMDVKIKTKATQEFSFCPHCGRKGLYQLHGKYCRCRYCGVYRILLRESDFWEKRTPVPAGQKRGSAI